MAAHKHPLDLFRASKSGFESATRDSRDPRAPRRRVSGKVLVSTPREDRVRVAPAEPSDEDVDAEPREAPPVASVEEDVAPAETPSAADERADEPNADEPTADEPATAAQATDADDDDAASAEDPSDDGPANALEAILAQRRALGDDTSSPDAPSGDGAPGAKPRRRVTLPPKPLEPVGLEAARGPASVTRPLNQVARPDDAGLPHGVSSRTRTLSYKLLGAAGGLVVALVLWSLLTDGDGGETPSLSKAALANAGTDELLGTAATPSEFTIQAVSYGRNVDAAQAAADQLEALGFDDVEITGVPDGEGGFMDVTLLVGRADSKAALAPVLQRLRDTPLGGEERPFYTAYVVGHPAAE